MPTSAKPFQQFSGIVNKFICQHLEKFCLLFEHIAQLGSRLPTRDTVVHFSTCTSSGPDGSVSRVHCASSVPMHGIACVQVSVSYHHLSLGPQVNNPLFCRSAFVLHSRSARYNWDQPDTTGVTWCQCPCSGMHEVKILYTTTFHLGFKIATLCFRQMHLSWLGPRSDITLSTDRLLLRADCLSGAVYIPSLPKHKSRRCISEISHFLSTITSLSTSIQKIPKNPIGKILCSHHSTVKYHPHTTVMFFEGGGGLGFEKGFLGWVGDPEGVFDVLTYPRKGCVTAE